MRKQIIGVIVNIDQRNAMERFPLKGTSSPSLNVPAHSATGTIYNSVSAAKVGILYRRYRNMIHYCNIEIEFFGREVVNKKFKPIIFIDDWSIAVMSDDKRNYQ